MAEEDGPEDQSVEAERETVEPTEELETENSTEAVLDVEKIREREQSVEELYDRIESQSERIEKLEDLLLDLSTRAAHDGGTGVCPDCNGPVIKKKPLLRRNRIECTQCGRVFHEY